VRVALNSLSLIMSLVSLTYSAVLFFRVLELGGARLASDVILYAYVASTLAFISGLVLFKMFKADDNVVLKNALFVLGTVAVICWYGLHLSGSVYSHASIFN